jgi:alkylation response protein AidB-like acyl-CoA dehydrogenase
MSPLDQAATADHSSAPDGGAISEGRSLAAFRSSLVEWLSANLTPEVIEAERANSQSEGQAHLHVLREWNARLADARWAAVAWPSRYGGRDATLAEQLAYHEEMVRAGAPGPVNTIGVSNIAPAIMQLGTDEQKERFLRPMLRGDELWCQGMSEPDAGSDLASLRTAARREDDAFVVSGQKTWNSLGRHAHWCQLYVRTDPTAPKHKGISCLLVDMASPGITVRPLRTMSGEFIFAELFFDDVVVPQSNLLGPLNEGWRVAMTTLSHERAGVARLHLELSARFEDLLLAARRTGPIRDAVQRDHLARLYADIACLRFSTSRELAAIGQGGQPSAAMGGLAKLAWSNASQSLAELAVDMLGLGALLGGTWTHELLLSPAYSIAGGTGDINRNVVAEHALGLPR